MGKATLGGALALFCSLSFYGCGGSSPPAVGSSAPEVTPQTVGTVFTICPGPQAQTQALRAFFAAQEGDTIHFCAGRFDFDKGLALTGVRGITIEGEGRDKTILSFAASPVEDGININRVTGITVQHLTVYDAPGNGLRVFRSDYVTIRDVKVGWSISDPAAPNYNPDPKSWAHNGSYAFYPVLCHHVLIEDSISVGSADAGVYVGQSNDVLVRRTEAFHNVAGFEFENTYRAEFVDDVAHDNVGGFLVFDLPGRAQNGEKNLVHRVESYNNNIPTFAPRGAIVGDVPSGTGMLVLATDQLELYDNDIHNNDTLGLAIVNYGLADPNEASTKYDFYPEGIHVYGNRFTDNGQNPQLPDLSRDTCSGSGGLPGPGDSLDCLANNASLLPAILVLKNGGRSAQIIWDGAVDKPNGCAPFPTDRDGIPLNQSNPDEPARYEARVDERGRPNFYLYDPMPACKYNAWKFDVAGQLKRPENGLCIENNSFKESLTGTGVADFANVHFATPDPTDPANLQPADHAMPQDCPTVPTALLPEFAPRLGRFTPDPANAVRPTQAEIDAVCDGGDPQTINAPALAAYNCPRLDQYRLFADPENPMAAPRGFGVPYDLNTMLFTDYAVKYRFLFLPPGADGKPVKAVYQDHADCDTYSIYDCYTATLAFPVGTVIAKTFAFRNGNVDTPAETRLLIKRRNPDGSVRWVGLPYIWQDDGRGGRVAMLHVEGGTLAATYDYDDPDPEVVDANGSRVHYGPGRVDAYQVPSAADCLLCHGGDDREAGAAPIGPKVRNLNKDFDYPGTGEMNQLAYMQSKGLLDLPGDPSQLEKMPKFDVPGSSGQPPGSPQDVNARARAWLEVNCMHCHNPAGGAQNSGLFLDSFKTPIDESHGICKPPIAAGHAADYGQYDIVPGDAAGSILVTRIASDQPGVRMPPIARTVVQTEAVNLINAWVNNDVAQFADPNANKCQADSSALPILLGRPLLEHGLGG